MLNSDDIVNAARTKYPKIASSLDSGELTNDDVVQAMIQKHPKLKAEYQSNGNKQSQLTQNTQQTQRSEIYTDRRSLMDRTTASIKNWATTPQRYDQPDTTPLEKAKTVAKGALTGAELAFNPFAKAGILKNTAALAGVVGGSEFAKGLIDKKPLEQNITEAGSQAAMAGILNVGLYGGKELAKAGYKGLKKASERVQKTDAYNDIIYSLQDIGNKISEKSNQVVSNNAKVRQINQYLKKRNEKMTEFSTNMVNSVKKNALNSKDAVVKFVDEIEKSAQQKGVQLFNMINKVEPNVKKFFSKEYGNILESEIGNKPVNIYPTLSNLMGGLETPSTTTGTKNVLSTFINQLIPNMKDKSGVTALKTIAQSSPEQLAQGIPLKQAHWIKQALTDYGNELINSGRSSNIELGFIYKNSAKEIADSIDSQIGEGNVYTSLNRKYADYMNKKDAITSTFGKPQYWGEMGGTPQLTKGMPAAMEIANTLKSGQPITSEALQAMNQEFQGLNSMITLMKNSGLENDAKALESGLYELSDALTSVENVKAAKKQFDLLAKTDPELAQSSPIFDQYLKKIKGKETYSQSPYKQKQSELMDINTGLIKERQALRVQKTELDKERIRRARELKLSNDGIAITSTAGVMSQFLPASVKFPIRAAATIYQMGKNQSINVVPVLEKMRTDIINKIDISNVANRQNMIKSVNVWFDYATEKGGDYSE